MVTLFYRLVNIGVFSSNKIIIRAISCDSCADYSVIMGSSKITSQLQPQLLSTNDSINIAQVYVTGNPNPALSDYTKTYDYYIITGKLSALQKAKNGNVVYPVINVIKWDDIHPGSEWFLIILSAYLIILSIRFFIKFRVAYRPHASIAVLKTHSNPPQVQKE